MKRIDTGSEPGNRLLNLLVSHVERALPHLSDAWRSGDIEMDFNFRFLANKSTVDHSEVPTVLQQLHHAGLIRARFDVRMNCARISMRLAGAQIA